LAPVLISIKRSHPTEQKRP
jgi:hypothetical protein